MWYNTSQKAHYFAYQLNSKAKQHFSHLLMSSIKEGRPGRLCFDSHDDLCTMQLDLDYRDGLYYCPTDVFTVDQSPVRHPGTHRLVSPPLPCTTHLPSRFSPTSKSKQLESEVWLLPLGSPGVRQLDVLPGNVMGLPLVVPFHRLSGTGADSEISCTTLSCPHHGSQALFLYGFWIYASIYL
jgi:hypothetical protein